MKKALLKGAVASAVTFLLLAPLAARADVKIETLSHLSEVTGLSNHDSDTTDYFQGDKKREENQRKLTGALGSAWQSFRGEDKGSMDIDIYDVSANKHWDVDPQKKTYSVESIYDPNQPSNAPPEGGTNQQRDKQQQQQDQDTKITKNEFTVKDTGQTKNINGFDTHEYLVTWDVETLNTKTGEKGRDLMTTDTWTSTDFKLAKAREAEQSYDKAYRKLMHQPEPQANAMYNVYGLDEGHVQVDGQDVDMKSVYQKLSTIKGLPVSMDVRWEAGGTDKDGKQTNDSDAGKSGKSLDSALGGLFGHKSDDSSSQPGTPGLTTIFSSHYEVKAVDTGAVDAAQFQTPSDYKLDN